MKFEWGILSQMRTIFPMTSSPVHAKVIDPQTTLEQFAKVRSRMLSNAAEILLCVYIS
jgi:hypothetical protein